MGGAECGLHAPIHQGVVDLDSVWRTLASHISACVRLISSYAETYRPPPKGDLFMSLRVKSLATGSSGNAILVQAGETSLLIDCGLPTRSVEAYLRQRQHRPGHSGSDPADPRAHRPHPVGRRHGPPLQRADRRQPAHTGRRPICPGRVDSIPGTGHRQHPHIGRDRGGILSTSRTMPPSQWATCLTYKNWNVCVILDAGKPSYEMRAASARGRSGHCRGQP